MTVHGSAKEDQAGAPPPSPYSELAIFSGRPCPAVMAAAPRPPHVTARAGAGGRQAKGEEAGAVTWRRRRRARAVRAAAAEGTGRAEGRCRRLPPAAAAVSECGAATVLEGGGGGGGRTGLAAAAAPWL